MKYDTGDPDESPASFSHSGPKASDYDEFPGSGKEKPWEDAGLLRQLYVDEGLSMNQIRKGWGCSGSTVSKHLGEHGIDKRTRSEAANMSHSGTMYGTNLGMDSDNYMRWTPGDKYLSVHRLLAVAEWGFDAVCGMHVHHKNEIRWDNRPENLELITNSDHQKHHHTKVSGMDRVRVAELYENGDVSYRKLHDVLDYDQVTWHTLMEIHKEFYQ